MAHFTDEVYLYQEDLLEHGFAASYDPAILRAQAWTARLAYIQAVQSYIYSWKQLVAAVGLRQLPLSEVAGRIDAFIPYYDYDKTLAYVLQHNSQVFIARNGIDLAKYNLKLAQVTPWVPDVDFQVGIFKDFAVPPQAITPTAQVGVPIPIWDQNKGAIRSAEAALVRALEEPHRVEVTLTNSLAVNYANYKNNLAALEYYRKYILPDQVRAFRGVDERRRFDINALSLTDLATAQQNLSTSVTTYLGILGSLWSSVVSVADLMDTEDLFQMAEEKELPPLPDLEHLPPLPCSHPCARAWERRPSRRNTVVRPPRSRRSFRPRRLPRPRRRLLQVWRARPSNRSSIRPRRRRRRPRRRKEDRRRPLAVSETLGSPRPRRSSEQDMIRRAAGVSRLMTAIHQPAYAGRPPKRPRGPKGEEPVMARKTGLLAALAVLAGAPFASQSYAQAPDLAPPPRTVPADAAEYNPLPDLPRPPDVPRSLTAPATTPLYEPALLPGPYFERDPLLDPPELPPPGWFADVDMLITKPHVLNHLTNASLPGGAPDVVSLPSAPLDWTVAPRFEIGRTLPSGFGSIAVAYRFLADEGTGATMGFDAPAVLKSRLDLNILDLDYISRELTPWPLWNLTWRVGFRTGWIYFDSQADEPFAAAAAGSGVFEQRTTDSFVGFGPHGGVLVDRGFPGTGLSLYAKSDFWIDVGRITQGFDEVTTTPGPGGLPLTETTRVGSGQAVPALDLEAGLHWRPLQAPYTEFFLGYQYEYWWSAGRLSLTPDSRGSLFDQGILLRAAFNF